jgi:hypothetical protein
MTTTIAKMFRRRDSVSLESWKLVWEIVALAAVGLSVVAGSVALILGNSINKSQAGELRQFAKDLTGAQTELAKLQGDNLSLSNDLANKDAEIASARKEAAEANRQGAEASTKTERFRLDIAKANENAAEANRVAEEERLKRVQIEERMKPRSLKLSPEAMSTLKAYKGTEYTFSSVFADEESITLLKQLDSILLDAGWTKVKPPHAFPAINVYGQDQDFSVASSLSSSIKISVDSDIPLGTLQSIPVDHLPTPVGAAAILAIELTKGLTPQQDDGVKANIQPGKSMTVRIEIGRKP